MGRARVSAGRITELKPWLPEIGRTSSSLSPKMMSSGISPTTNVGMEARTRDAPFVRERIQGARRAVPTDTTIASVTAVTAAMAASSSVAPSCCPIAQAIGIRSW